MFGQQPAHPFSWHTSMIEGEKSSRNTALISGESIPAFPTPLVVHIAIDALIRYFCAI